MLKHSNFVNFFHWKCRLNRTSFSNSIPSPSQNLSNPTQHTQKSNLNSNYCFKLPATLLWSKAKIKRMRPGRYFFANRRNANALKSKWTSPLPATIKLSMISPEWDIARIVRLKVPSLTSPKYIIWWCLKKNSSNNLWSIMTYKMAVPRWFFKKYPSNVGARDNPRVSQLSPKLNEGWTTSTPMIISTLEKFTIRRAGGDSRKGSITL